MRGSGPTGFEGIKIRPEGGAPQFEPALYVYPKAIGQQPACPTSSLIGLDKVLSTVEPTPGSEKYIQAPLEGKVWNLETISGFSATYGANLYTGRGNGTPIDLGLGEGPQRIQDLHAHDHRRQRGMGGPTTTITSKSTTSRTGPHRIAADLLRQQGSREGSKRKGKRRDRIPELGGERKFIRNPTSCNPPGPATRDQAPGGPARRHADGTRIHGARGHGRNPSEHVQGN